MVKLLQIEDGKYALSFPVFALHDREKKTRKIAEWMKLLSTILSQSDKLKLVGKWHKL